MAAIDWSFAALYAVEAFSIGIAVLSIAGSINNILRAKASIELRDALCAFTEKQNHGSGTGAPDLRGDPPVGDETYIYTAHPSPDSSEADTSVEIDESGEADTSVEIDESDESE